MIKYISIGAQCATPILFERLGVKSETLPFDWMISTPQFVYVIMKLLLVDKMSVEDIVDSHFFLCDTTAIADTPEHFVINKDGPFLINSKYGVCFPHDTLLDRDKYVRRMNRLLCMLLDGTVFIHFVYVSVSSDTSGNYTIDGYEPIQQLYEYIEKINTIIGSVRSNYKITVFDTSGPMSVIPTDTDHIAYYSIKKANSWIDMLPELVDKCCDMINFSRHMNFFL